MEVESQPTLEEASLAVVADPEKKTVDNESENVTPNEGTSGIEYDKPGKDSKPEECPKSVSPEPNCSICLGKLENKSFTDSCFHTFCFVCLLEWSKVKAVCPLCKQAFKSIIHNVRSFEDYDQYHLRTEEQAAEELETRRFRFHSTMTNDRWWNHLRMENQRQLALLRRPSRDTLATQWRRQRQAATSAYRRRIYSSGMRVQEVRTATGRTMRYREVSPEFYCRNPACMHRLVPWLNRELNVLLNNHEDHVQFVLELIMDLIKRFDIRSEEFFQHIQPFTGRHTEHFVHEFYSFARSPYDMFAYDQRAVYNEVEDPPVHTVDSSDNDSSVHSTTVIDPDDDDPDVILISSTEPNSLPADEMTTSQDHPYSSAGSILMEITSSDSIIIPENQTSLVSQMESLVSGADVRRPGESTWDSPTPGPSNVEFQFNAMQGTSDMPIDVTGTTPTVKIKEETDDDKKSDSSDVIVVGYEKPWEERSPLQISSDDEEERRAARERERQERKRQKQNREREKAKKHKKQRSRSCSRERQSHSHSHSSNKSKKIRHSRERSRTHSRHDEHRRRSCSKDRYKKDSRELIWERSKERDRQHWQAKEYSSSRHRSSMSRSPRHHYSRDDGTCNRDRHRHREVRSQSLENLQYSVLGQYDYSDTRSERGSKQGRKRASEMHLRRHSRSPSEERRRQSSHVKEHPDRRQCRRSRSKSVEIVFRRRDRSKDRHKRDKKHKSDGHSSTRSEHSVKKSKHKHSKERTDSRGLANENKKQSSDQSLRSGSSDSRTDGEPHRGHYKKHPTGHKISKSHSDNPESSCRTSDATHPETARVDKVEISPVSETHSDPDPSRHLSHKHTEDDIFSSDSDLHITRHRHNVQSISSESDFSSSDVQMTSSSECAAHQVSAMDTSSARSVSEGVSHSENELSGARSVSIGISHSENELSGVRSFIEGISHSEDELSGVRSFIEDVSHSENEQSRARSFSEGISHSENELNGVRSFIEGVSHSENELSRARSVSEGVSHSESGLNEETTFSNSNAGCSNGCSSLAETDFSMDGINNTGSNSQNVPCSDDEINKSQITSAE